MGGLLGGLIKGVGRIAAPLIGKAGTWLGRQTGIVKAAGKVITKVATNPVGGAVIAGGAVAGATAVINRARGGQSSEAIIRQMYAEHGNNNPDPGTVALWSRQLDAGEITLDQIRAQLTQAYGPQQTTLGGGGGLMLGQFPLVVEPEAATSLRCPKGYSLADFGDGPACYPTKVLVALGVRRASRRGGGITGREIAAARKVQRFGQGLFVNKQPKVKLRKGRGR